MIKLNKIIKCLQNLQFFWCYLKGVSPVFELDPLLRVLPKINNLIDIGSNKGQFALLARGHFPNLKIYSFEPLKEELKKQKKILGNNNINYYNFALGDTIKNIKINIVSRRDSSSILNPIEKYSQDYKKTSVRSIHVDKLDNILKNKNLKSPNLLKIDVQGYELRTLKGAKNSLKKIDYIIIEISYMKMYENQVIAKDLKKFLKNNNFKVLKKCNKTIINNKIYQEDILLKKK